MVDRIAKSLRKLSNKEQGILHALLVRIKSGNFENMDIKKLKGRGDIYRVRKGDIRIIFYRAGDGIHILSVERRNETTYNE